MIRKTFEGTRGYPTKNYPKETNAVKMKFPAEKRLLAVATAGAAVAVAVAVAAAAAADVAVAVAVRQCDGLLGGNGATPHQRTPHISDTRVRGTRCILKLNTLGSRDWWITAPSDAS